MSTVQERWAEMVKKAQASPTWGLEGAILDFTEAVCTAMQEQGVSKSALAKRMGCSYSKVRNILAGDQGMRLKTMVEMANALGLRVEIRLKPKER